MDWVPLMLVCRHWRNVGISTPWLWRIISITDNLQSLQYRLSRTVGCTIDLFISISPEHNEAAIPLLLPFARSIRSIQVPSVHFSLPCDTLLSIKPLFGLALSALEYVDITADVRSEDQLQPPVDLGLSKKLHPKLRRFVVTSYVAMPLEHEVWGALRELDMSIRGRDDRHERVDEFLRVLAGAPHLERLVVVRQKPEYYTKDRDIHYPTAKAAPESDWMPIVYRLDKLRRIRLDGQLPFIARVLESIDAPALLYLNVSACVPSHVDAAGVAPQLLPPPLRHMIKKCEGLRASSNDSLDFFIHSDDFQKRAINTGDKNITYVYLHVTGNKWSVSPLPAAISALCDVFHTAPLRSLSFCSFRLPAPPDAWKLLQATFCDLRKVAITGHRSSILPQFLEALRDQCRAGRWRPLSRLVLDFCIDSSMNSMGWHKVFTLLEDSARAKCQQGTRLETISLRRMYIARAQLRPHTRAIKAISTLCDELDFSEPQFSHYPRSPPSDVVGWLQSPSDSDWDAVSDDVDTTQDSAVTDDDEESPPDVDLVKMIRLVSRPTLYQETR